MCTVLCVNYVQNVRFEQCVQFLIVRNLKYDNEAQYRVCAVCPAVPVEGVKHPQKTEHIQRGVLQDRQVFLQVLQALHKIVQVLQTLPTGNTVTSLDKFKKMLLTWYRNWPPKKLCIH